MEFTAWLAANGYDADKLTDSQRKHLQAAFKAETEPVENSGGTFDAKMRAIEEEESRLAYIREATVTACERNRGNHEKVKMLRQLCDAACADTKMGRRDFDVALLRADRWVGPMVIGAPAGQNLNDEVLEAAVCLSQKVPGAETKFSDQVLQTAHTRFRRGIGLQELLAIAAERNVGYRGSARDTSALCRAAFAQQNSGYYDMRAEGMTSTISVAGILSNVANKSLAAQFLFTEQTWRMVAFIRPANDFKQMSTYRLGGNNTFEKVAPGGEIKHGTLSDTTYTNQVETYGKMLGIDRRDIINDDLGAFAGATRELGRGAGDSLNQVFWAEWLDDSDFFNTDASKDNYATGAALSLAGLNTAEVLFRLQTKPDGTPLGVLPRILLTPATLANTAAQLMGSQGLVVGTTPASGPDRNVFSGRYQATSSVYLDASSTSNWYLLADPNDVAAIEVAFLNGNDTPTVETSAFDFDRLGLAMRAFMDFGVNKQEYRAAVKLHT